MKKITAQLLALAPLAALVALAFSSGCANTTTPPSGGDKDTIPPYITKIYPLPGTTSFPTEKSKIVVTFNEYVKIKDSKCIFLSPPQKKAPKYKIQGKSLVVWTEEPLDSNQTYTLDLTGAVCDNNEGNMFPGYTLTFSTGESIDSLAMTGTVQNSTTLLPVKGATVLLYKDQSDSAVFKSRPVAAAKTDEWGFFSIRNIADTIYRVYAIQDANGNNIYDPDTEQIAFLDSLFRPVLVASDTLPELMKYDMKDTLGCLARTSEVELNLFREKPSKQFVKNKVRVGDRTAYMTFMAPSTKVHALKIKGLPKEKLVSQFNVEGDSLELWVNDANRMPDTLMLMINYDKTDSLGKLVPTTEEIPFVYSKEQKAEIQKKKLKREVKKEDTTCVFTLEAKPENVEQYGFVFEFKYPLTEADFSVLEFRSVNPRQQQQKGAFRVTRDSTNVRKFTVMPQEKFLVGYDYFLKVPYHVFRDVNGFYNDSTEVKVTLPTAEDLSTLNLNMKNVHSTYLVELLNEKRNNVLRSYLIKEDQILAFPYLKKGSYCIRVTEDLNGNGIVDTGNVLAHLQPEKVKFYKTGEGGDSFLYEVPERAELLQDIDIAELFK